MKRCVITGAASGIGKALAQNLGAQGYELIAIDKDKDATSALEKTLKAQGIAISSILADLSLQADLERLVDALNQPIDLLIHSAGINAVAPFRSSDIEVQKAVLDINLKAPLYLSNRLIDKGALDTGGIIFISSLSHFVSYPGASVYAASKDGLSAYARSLALALKPKIQVMTVFPGPTRTPHARQHSPDNSKEHLRMPPELLASKIIRAYEQKRSRYVPGFANKLFAFLGTYIPSLTQSIMKHSIYNKLEEQSKGP